MTDLVFEYRGTLDKYIGDELMAVFGAPITGPDDTLRAVRCAVALQRCNAELNAVRRREGRISLDIGIGVETGEVIAGYIGSPRRMEFTVVGDRVNTAKRFCDMAGPGKVVIGHTTWEQVAGDVVARPIGTVNLKGKDLPAQAYEVLSLKDDAD